MTVLQRIRPTLFAPPLTTRRKGREARERRMLEEKMFQRMDKFGGDEKMYKEWEYNLRVILSSGSYKFGVALEAVAQEPCCVCRGSSCKLVDGHPPGADGLLASRPREGSCQCQTVDLLVASATTSEAPGSEMG